MAIQHGTYAMCSDGTRFYDETGLAEALDHEAKLDQLAQIERFIASQTWERGQETRARNIIEDFVEFQRAEAEGVLDQVAGIVRRTYGPEDAQGEVDDGAGEDGMTGDFLRHGSGEDHAGIEETADPSVIDETADLDQAMLDGAA